MLLSLKDQLIDIQNQQFALMEEQSDSPTFASRMVALKEQRLLPIIPGVNELSSLHAYLELCYKSSSVV